MEVYVEVEVIGHVRLVFVLIHALYTVVQHPQSVTTVLEPAVQFSGYPPARIHLNRPERSAQFPIGVAVSAFAQILVLTTNVSLLQFANRV